MDEDIADPNTIPMRVLATIGVDPTLYDVSIDKIYGGFDTDFDIVRVGDKHELQLAAGNALNHEVSGGAITLKLKLTHNNGGFTYQVILIEINDIVGVSISGDKSANILIGDKNANTISGYLGDDIIFGRGGADAIDGNGGNDVLYGGAGADTIDGGDGDDVFYGGAGADRLTGGDGRDHFVLDLDASSPADANTITDFNAGDDSFRIIERTGKLEQIARTGFLDVATAEAQYGITFRANKKSIFKIVGQG